MDFLMGYIMVAVIMLCMGFSLIHVGIMTLLLIGVFIVLIGAFFAVCLVLLFFSRKARGVFVSINEEKRFPVAVYKINGEEILNLFPCEMIMKNRLYVPEKEISLLYCKPRRAAIDKNALVTVIVGSVIFIPSAVFAAIVIARYLFNLFG